jgi:LPXTG-site transpeptidase (sortase) family protein
MTNKKNIVPLVVTVVFFALVAVAVYFLLRQSYPTKNSSVTVSGVPKALSWIFPPSATKFPSTGSASGGNLAYSALPDPGGIPSGLPLRLQIPVIGVDSAIEDALITPDGRMDVPAGTEDVAWFALGPQPGQTGSAVIGGHYGIQNGLPFVFYDLNKLKVGDNIYITNDIGQTFTFAVRSIASFGLNADATTVFTSSDGMAHLNLITCEGTWNAIDGNYPDRLVIFTDLISSKGVVPTITLAPRSAPATNTSDTFSQSLGIGDTGAGVVTLQTFLEQRGLLELPAGVTNGFFGSLTSAALARYQASAGLPVVGVLGPLTRARLNLELAKNIISILPSTGIVGTQKSPISTPIFIQLIQSMFATPLDGLLTSLLLIVILFMIFKIIRR